MHMCSAGLASLLRPMRLPLALVLVRGGCKKSLNSRRMNRQGSRKASMTGVIKMKAANRVCRPTAPHLTFKAFTKGNRQISRELRIKSTTTRDTNKTE